MPQTTPPKANPARRNPRTGPLKLPAEGRQEPPPAWPLPQRQTAEQRKLWVQLWATPHAVAWERLGWVRTVARYCLILPEAEALQKDALAEARQLEDRLGLTPKAMRMLLWEISSDELADRRPASADDVRRRIRAV